MDRITANVSFESHLFFQLYRTISNWEEMSLMNDSINKPLTQVITQLTNCWVRVSLIGSLLLICVLIEYDASLSKSCARPSNYGKTESFHTRFEKEHWGSHFGNSWPFRLFFLYIIFLNLGPRVRRFFAFFINGRWSPTPESEAMSTFNVIFVIFVIPKNQGIWDCACRCVDPFPCTSSLQICNGTWVNR